MSRSALAPSSYDSLKWTRLVQDCNHLGGIILPPIKQWQPQRPTNKLPPGRKMGADLPLLLLPIKKLEKASTRMSHKSSMKFQVHLYQQPSYISLLIKKRAYSPSQKKISLKQFSLGKKKKLKVCSVLSKCIIPSTISSYSTGYISYEK